MIRLDKIAALVIPAGAKRKAGTHNHEIILLGWCLWIPGLPSVARNDGLVLT
jgi:hypothetical protein